MNADKAAHFLVVVKPRGPFAVLVLRVQGVVREHDAIELPARAAEPEDLRDPNRVVLWAISYALLALGLDPDEMAQAGWGTPELELRDVPDELSFDELSRRWHDSKAPTLAAFHLDHA